MLPPRSFSSIEKLVRMSCGRPSDVAFDLHEGWSHQEVNGSVEDVLNEEVLGIKIHVPCECRCTIGHKVL